MAIALVAVIVIAGAAIAIASYGGIGIVQTKTVTTIGTSTITTMSPVSSNIVNGVVTVGGRTYEDYSFTVPSDATGATVSGSFTASGGSGNDIIVIVTDSTDFVNWVNGHAFSAYYDSGQTTTGSFNVQVSGPGTYYVIYSNQFSLLSSKNVDTQVNLDYQVPATGIVTYTTTYLTS